MIEMERRVERRMEEYKRGIRSEKRNMLSIDMDIRV